MSRTEVAIFAACGLVGLGAIALYRELENDPVGASPPSAAEAAPEPALEAPPLIVQPQAPPLEAGPVPAGPAAVADRKVAEEDAPYPRDLTKLVKALQPLQAEVVAGLAAMDDRSRCHFQNMDVQLTLETGRGEVLIRKVVIKPRPVEREETAEARNPEAGATEEFVDEADVRCVREALEGKALPAPSARPGRRWQQWYRPTPRPH